MSDNEKTPANAEPEPASAQSETTPAKPATPPKTASGTKTAEKPNPTPIGVQPVQVLAPPPAGPAMVLQRQPVPVFPWWRPPLDPAAPRVLGVGIVTGVAAAALVPQNVGVGWFLAGLVGVGAFLFHVRRPTVGQSLWLAAALALLGIGAIRDAEWLFPLCVMAAMLCGSLALVNGKSVLSLAFSTIAVPLASLRAIPWVARGVAKARPRNVRSIVSVAVSVVLLLVFGSLLAGADPAFNALMEKLVPELDPDTVSWWVFLFCAAGAGAFGACYLVAAPAQIKESAERRTGTLRPKDYALPVGVLLVLFTGFLVTQATVMFRDERYVVETAGVTFAEYARSGFWQLLWVTVLTLAVIGVVARFAAKETTRDANYLRALLGALAVLTLVIVASALSRMWLYQEAYGFTVLRVLVGACELWLGLVYVLVIVSGIRLEAGWLPRAVVGTGVAFFLALAVANPEAVVAERNVSRWKDTGKIDTWYLRELSADALPAIYQLPEPLRSCAIWSTRFTPDRGEDWRHWNLSRENGRELLKSQPLNNSCEEDRPYR